jgi:DMSO/TMAO reductase YedYZ molybdopterin-dependent catalytic subunit
MRSPPLGAGALAGVLLTPPALALLFMLHLAAYLPFPPFDVFDWTARVLPGGLVTFGIDTIASLIEFVAPGETASLAKPAEQTLAVAGALAAGIVVAVVLAVTLARVSKGIRDRVTVLVGMTLAVAIVLVSRTVNEAYDAIVLPALWIGAVSVCWTWAVGQVAARLAMTSAPPAPSAPSAPPVSQLDRRRFLIQVGGASAAITVVGAGVALTRRSRASVPEVSERWSAMHPLPNADDPVKPARGTRPEFTALEDHYRIDINTSPPRIDERAWRLSIGGLVRSPARLTLRDLRQRFTPLHQFVTLACISNRIGGSLTSTTRWTGVPLRDVMAYVGLDDDATHVVMRSADGFHETVARELFEADERVMLTYAWDGVPLLRGHGFPVRIYVPDRYGMKQPKWIVELEAVDQWEAGYWVERNWDREAHMQTTSVIDTVATDMMVAAQDAQTMVPVGGIAHAGARGISRVEVRVDDGPWVAARLRTPLSRTTWAIWRYDWPFSAGDHTFTVRCVDGNGVPQIAEEHPMRPSGATGLDSEAVRL